MDGDITTQPKQGRWAVYVFSYVYELTTISMANIKNNNAADGKIGLLLFDVKWTLRMYTQTIYFGAVRFAQRDISSTLNISFSSQIYL